MSDNTSIEWATLDLDRGASWNPIRARNKATGAKGHHCEHVSPGCINCYAERQNKRGIGTGLDYKPGNREQVEIYLDEKALLQPLRWKAPRGIFVCSMTDIFADFVSDDMRDRIFAVMALSPHRFAALTKRSKAMLSYLTTSAQGTGERRDDICVAAMNLNEQLERNGEYPFTEEQCFVQPDRWPLPNVWLGVTAEDQTRADERIPDLLATPAAVRFVSVEPMLGGVEIDQYLLELSERDGDGVDSPGVDWVICGGESGANARPMHPDWARSLRDQCADAGVPFFFKQWGEWHTCCYRGAFDPVFRQFDTYQHWVNKAATWVNGGICLDRNGRELKTGADMARARDEGMFPVTIMHMIGKRQAGRLLDGREHSEFPGGRQ